MIGKAKPITWEKVRDLLVVLGIVVAVSQLYLAQKSLETAGAGLILGPYMQSRSTLVDVGTLNPDATDVAIREYVAITKVMCDLDDRGMLIKPLHDLLEKDVAQLKANQSVDQRYLTPLKDC